MNIDEFIHELEFYAQKHDMLFAPKKIHPDQISSVEAAVDAKFGPELRDYLTELGIISYDAFETFGINAANPIHKSDLVEYTNMLHEYFPATLGLTAICSEFEYYYFLADHQDQIYKLSPDEDVLEPTGLKLFDFLLIMLHKALALVDSLEIE